MEPEKLSYTFKYIIKGEEIGARLDRDKLALFKLWIQFEYVIYKNKIKK